MVDRVPAPLLAALADLVKWLDDAKMPSMIIGGVAASVLGRPRLTLNRWVAGYPSGMAGDGGDYLGLSMPRRLQASAVDLFHLECVCVDTVHAPDIDGRHFYAGLRVCSKCKRLDPAS